MLILLTLLACVPEYALEGPPIVMVNSDCDADAQYIYQAGTWVEWCPEWCACSGDTGDTGGGQ
jgi:hypothetical protein